MNCRLATIVMLVVGILECGALAFADPPPLGRGRVIHKNVDVVLGVDALGRFAMAMDQDKDGLVDQCFQFVWNDRIDTGVWSRFLTNVRVDYQFNELTVVSPGESYGVVLATDRAEHPTKIKNPTFETFVRTDGLALQNYKPGPLRPQKAMGDMNFDNIESWPESFWYDYHDPDTVGGGGGGAGGRTCFCDQPTLADDDWVCLTAFVADPPGPDTCDITCDGDESVQNCSSNRACCCGCRQSLVNPGLEVPDHRCMRCQCITMPPCGPGTGQECR